MNHPTKPPDDSDPREDVAREGRGTFLSVREVLERVVDVLRATRLHLQAVEPEDERARLFASGLINRRSKLEYSIEESIQAAPSDALDTYVQYAADPAEAGPDAPPGRDPETLVRWQTDANASLIRILEELADRVENPTAAELFRAVADLLRAHDQNVAVELQELRDI